MKKAPGEKIKTKRNLRIFGFFCLFLWLFFLRGYFNDYNQPNGVTQNPVRLWVWDIEYRF